MAQVATQCLPFGFLRMATRRNMTLTRWAPTANEDFGALNGQDVFSANGEQLGTIKAVYHFGELDETCIPEAAIADFREDGVYLNLTEEQIKNQSWPAPADLASYRRV
jgi:hypothetical protein